MVLHQTDKFEGSTFLKWVYCTRQVLCYMSAFGLPELDLLKYSGQSLFPKTIWISIQTNQLQTLVQFRLSVANIRVQTCFLLVWSFIKGKLPVKSLVPSLTLNNLIPFTIYFSFVYLSLDKKVPLRVGKSGNLPDWQNWDRSGLAKLGPFRIGKYGTLPD